MFREKTGAFRKVIGKHADLVFITAPHEVPPMTPEDSSQVIFLHVRVNLLLISFMIH